MLHRQLHPLLLDNSETPDLCSVSMLLHCHWTVVFSTVLLIFWTRDNPVSVKVFQITVATFVMGWIIFKHVVMTVMTMWMTCISVTHTCTVKPIHLFSPPTWNVCDGAFSSTHRVRGRETRWTGHQSQANIPTNTATLTFKPTGILEFKSGPTYGSIEGNWEKSRMENLQDLLSVRQRY